MLYRNWFELQACLRMSPLKWDVSQPSKMFIAREIMHEIAAVSDFKILDPLLFQFREI